MAEEDRVTYYSYQEGQYAFQKKLADLPTGGNHTSRSIHMSIVDGEQRLLVSTGSSCNVCVEADTRRAAIYSMKLDGADFKLFASGLRNSVFMATVLAHKKCGRPIWAETC